MKKVLKFFMVLVMLTAALLAVGYVGLSAGLSGYDTDNEIESTAGVSHSGYTNIAIFGVDSRDGNLESANSDSIMIASINNKTNEIQLVSVYRDTVLDSGDGYYRKANAAYMLGGPAQAVTMLNKNLDLDISKYIAVDFTAASEIVDAVGGIELDLTAEECYYINYYIEETSDVAGKTAEFLPEADGTYTLNGTQATSYCRIRYTAGNDFKRAERQRTVLSKVLEKLKTPNPVTLYSAASSVLSNMKTNMNAAELTSIGLKVMGNGLENSTGWPFNPSTMDVSGLGSCVVAEDLSQEVIQLHEFLFGSTPTLSATAIQASIGLDQALGRS